MHPHQLFTLRAFKTLTFIASTILVIISCSKGGEDPEPLPAVKATNLIYSPATLNINPGTSATSNKPTISGTTPISYSISSSPANNGGITIDAEGRIAASATLASGTYNVSVTATNAAGTTAFTNVFIVTVTTPSSTPQNLVYSPNNSTVTQGTAVTSATPTISGTGTIAYSISTVPSNSAISINSQGVISATSALPAGTYLVSVTATNSSGSSTFSNAYTIQVNSATGSGSVTYTNTVQAIIANNCTACHVNGGQTPSLSNYTQVKNNIDAILTRINLPQGAPGMMPNGGTKLSQTTINQIQKWKDDGLLQ